jgi:hypothetical protein
MGRNGVISHLAVHSSRMKMYISQRSHNVQEKSMVRVKVHVDTSFLLYGHIYEDLNNSYHETFNIPNGKSVISSLDSFYLSILYTGVRYPQPCCVHT